MPLEIEQKFRVAGHDRIRQQVAALDAQPLGLVEQVDQYFRHPARDFGRTGEALRIRRTGDTAVVTYKGPKLDAVIKTRPEIELPLASEAVQFGELLVVLGFTPIAEVRKHRERYSLSRSGVDLELAIDSVDGVGQFVEVEAIAGQDGMNQAKAAVVQLVGELGLTELEPRSYLRMLLENRGDSDPVISPSPAGRGDA